MKLRYYTKDNEKIYTLKNKVNNTPTKNAHYKYIKIKSQNPCVNHGLKPMVCSDLSERILGDRDKLYNHL